MGVKLNLKIYISLTYMYNRTHAEFGQCKVCKAWLNIEVFKAPVGHILSARVYHFNLLIILS